MKIFAIDTSAVAASCALAEDGKIIFEFYTNAGLQHSRTLAPMIESAFKCTEISISDVDCFAVSKGPGSFTGVRIGIAAVKGMAFEKDKPCVGVSTLEAMAYNLECVKGIICSVMDARCSQVYNALFEFNNGELSRLCDDRVLTVDELGSELKNEKKPIIFVGDGALLCYNRLKDSLFDAHIAPEGQRFQRASGVIKTAQTALSKGQSVSAGELLPSYLRLPQAVRNLKEKQKET